MTGLLLALLVAVGIAVLVRGGDVDQPPPTPTGPSERQDLASETLQDLEAAVEVRDAQAAAALAAVDDDRADVLLRGIAANARALDVADFTMRYVDEDLAVSDTLPKGEWAAAVDTTWRFRGFDREPGHAEVTVTFSMDDGEAALVSIGGGGRRAPLWLTGRLQVRRTSEALVMVAGQQRTLGRFARLAETAVDVVERVLPPWPQKLVVEVPESPTGLDRTLGAGEGEYANIAAVTTTVDGTTSTSAPVHVFVNPEVLGGLKPQGAQVVMSHEATHVATEAATANTPLWLLEGFADYVALRDVDLPLSVTAGQVARQVRDDGVPPSLPDSDDFDTRTTHLGAAYEAAWLACRMLAEDFGEPNLIDFYQRASKGEPVGAALQDVYGFGVKELTRRWQAELRQLVA